MKKKILLTLVMLLSISLVTGCGCGKKKSDGKDSTKKEDKIEYNTNKGVVEDKEVEGLKLTNTSLKTSEYNSTLVTSVSNPTNKDIYVRIFNIYVKDKEGNTIVTLQGYVGGIVPAGDTRNITSNVDMNLKDAYKVDYELVND